MNQLEIRSSVKEESLDGLLTCQPMHLLSSLAITGLAVIEVKYMCMIPFCPHPPSFQVQLRLWLHRFMNRVFQRRFQHSCHP